MRKRIQVGYVLLRGSRVPYRVEHQHDLKQSLAYSIGLREVNASTTRARFGSSTCSVGSLEKESILSLRVEGNSAERGALTLDYAGPIDGLGTRNKE